MRHEPRPIPVRNASVLFFYNKCSILYAYHISCHCKCCSITLIVHTFFFGALYSFALRGCFSPRRRSPASRFQLRAFLASLFHHRTHQVHHIWNLWPWHTGKLRLHWNQLDISWQWQNLHMFQVICWKNASKLTFLGAPGGLIAQNSYVLLQPSLELMVAAGWFGVQWSIRLVHILTHLSLRASRQEPNAGVANPERNHTPTIEAQKNWQVWQHRIGQSRWNEKTQGRTSRIWDQILALLGLVGTRSPRSKKLIPA